MSTGLLKSAPQVKTQAPQPTVEMGNGFNSFEYDGVPIELYSMLDIPMDKATTKEKVYLRDLKTWASDQLVEKTLGNVMEQIRKLELKLGSARNGETKLTKMWQYVKLSKDIEDLSKRRDAFINGWV